MKQSPCCQPRAGAGPAMRRAGGVAGVFLSGLPLFLVPKCPVCVAAYVALFTGISVSADAAGQLRVGIIVLCVALPVFLMAICLRKLRGKGRMRPPEVTE